MPPRKSKRKSAKRKIRASSSSAASPSSPRVGPAFDKLVSVMARLRAPNGCPWDREQTHATLRTYLIEEAYEVLDALDSSDDPKFAEELGDLLLQVLFHAQIAHEEGRFSIQDVIREIYDKLIRRHPHVFGDTHAKSAAEVLRNWEIIKKQEREAKVRVVAGLQTRDVAVRGGSVPRGAERRGESLLDGVSRSLPALLEALQLTRKAARIGFDWHDVDGIFSKLAEETHELRRALASASPPVIPSEARNPSSSSSSLVESELGDLLFAAVNLARFLNIDPEIALKKSNSKFSRRFREMERLAHEQGTTLAQLRRPQMESLWDQVKLRE